MISHVTQTLGDQNTFVDYQDYLIPYGTATRDVQVILLMLLRQAGLLANTIFFVCSAWFLIGKSGKVYKKAFSLWLTV